MSSSTPGSTTCSTRSRTFAACYGSSGSYSTPGNGSNIGLATQRRGFGFIHDGSVSLTEFMAASVFTSTTQQERDLFAFLMAFPTESVPAIGRQVTVTAASKGDATVASTITTLIAQAEAHGCDLIVKGMVGGVAKGWVYDTAGNVPSRTSLAKAAIKCSPREV